jgi:hypothetical protein
MKGILFTSLEIVLISVLEEVRSLGSCSGSSISRKIAPGSHWIRSYIAATDLCTCIFDRNIEVLEMGLGFLVSSVPMDLSRSSFMKNTNFGVPIRFYVSNCQTTPRHIREYQKSSYLLQ